MGTKRWIPISVALLCLLLTFAGMTELKYDLNLLDYLKYSLPLSAPEKAYLKEQGGIVLGIDRSAPPLSFVDDKTGQNTGLVVDYMSSLSIELGVSFPCVPLPWSQVMDGLESGQIDTSDLFISAERQKSFAFTQPIYVLRGAVVVKTTPETGSSMGVSQLGGLRIAVPQDDFAQEYLTVAYGNAEKKPKLIPVSDIPSAIRLVQSGLADAAAGDETVIAYTLKNLESPEEFTLLEDVLYEKDVTFAVRKEDKQLLSILNKGILKLKKKDILTKTQEKWFGVSAPIIKDRSTYELISRLFFAAILAVVVFYYWDAFLRRKIREKTKEIQVSKGSLRNIIDSLHVYLLVMDQTHRIVECNALTEQLLHADRSQLLSSQVYGYPVLDAILKNLRPGEPVQVENRFYDLVIKEMTSLPGSTLLTIEDVTEKMLNQRRLRQHSKMIAAGQLSAGLAHEIRNPLGLIKNYLYIMRRYMTDETGQHAMTVAGESVDRINSLIESLLSFSRLSSDLAHEVSIHKLLSNILRLEEKQLLEKEIQTELQCHPNLKAWTNEEALKIILFNLVDNAIDSFDEKKNAEAGMEAVPRRLWISAAHLESGLTITVSDNGCGILESEIEHIFNPFYTTKDSGTGLGLFIVNSETEKLGGTIQASSSGGKTVFELCIPFLADR